MSLPHLLMETHGGKAITALLLLCSSPAVLGAIKDCDPVPGGFTIFLSEPQYTQSVFKDPSSMRDFMQRLTKQLDLDLDLAWAKSPNPVRVKFVNCVGRAPKLEGQEFDAKTIQYMYGKRVVLEIWGQLDARRSPSGLQPSAEIRYLLVPLKLYSDRSEVVADPMQRLDYVTEPVASPDFVDLIAKRKDINAFVTAAVGYKLLREEQNLEGAHQALCFASAELERIKKKLQTPRERERVAALQSFVSDSATRAIEGARAARAAGAKPSAANRLVLQDPKNPCDTEMD